MYGCFDPCLVYGFALDRSYKIDNDFLNDHFPEVQCYSLDVVRCNVGDSVYGIPVKFCHATGAAKPFGETDAEGLQQLNALRDLVLDRIKKGSVNVKIFLDWYANRDVKPMPTAEELSQLKYYLGVTGASDDARNRDVIDLESESESESSNDGEEEDA